MPDPKRQRLDSSDQISVQNTQITPGTDENEVQHFSTSGNSVNTPQQYVPPPSPPNRTYNQGRVSDPRGPFYVHIHHKETPHKEEKTKNQVIEKKDCSHEDPKYIPTEPVFVGPQPLTKPVEKSGFYLTYHFSLSVIILLFLIYLLYLQVSKIKARL